MLERRKVWKRSQNMIRKLENLCGGSRRTQRKEKKEK
jgi:hypothetical protein